MMAGLVNMIDLEPPVVEIREEKTAEALLAEMHDDLVVSLSKRIKSDEWTAADGRLALDLIKNSNIGDGRKNGPLQDLAETLPFDPKSSDDLD